MQFFSRGPDINPEEDFNRNLSEYQRGFGQPGLHTNFWLGLDNLHLLTSSRKYGLYVEWCCNLGEFNNECYHNFTVSCDFLSGMEVSQMFDKSRRSGWLPPGCLHDSDPNFTDPPGDNVNIRTSNCRLAMLLQVINCLLPVKPRKILMNRSDLKREWILERNFRQSVTTAAFFLSRVVFRDLMAEGIVNYHYRNSEYHSHQFCVGWGRSYAWVFVVNSN